MDACAVQKKRWLGTDGYTLLELMVVITITAILTAAATGVYHGYINRARESALYEKAYQIKEALLICEMEYISRNKMDSSILLEEALILEPNDPDSVLYQYVGEITGDCTDYTLKIGKTESGEYRINGFIYETEGYSIKWIRDSGITVEAK